MLIHIHHAPFTRVHFVDSDMEITRGNVSDLFIILATFHTWVWRILSQFLPEVPLLCTQNLATVAFGFLLTSVQTHFPPDPTARSLEVSWLV